MILLHFRRMKILHSGCTFSRALIREELAEDIPAGALLEASRDVARRRRLALGFLRFDQEGNLIGSFVFYFINPLLYDREIC